METVEHLYLHVPFCTHICPYCGFYKHRMLPDSLRVYLDAFPNEIRWVRENFRLHPRTIYFGGGTPSALSTAHLQHLFADWPWSEGLDEFGMECNPATLSPRKAALLRRIGVDRISLGVQAFDPEPLRLLGRTHSREDIHSTHRILRAEGFTNINLDLMFALPYQTLSDWRDTLQEALDLEPRHISAYNLTFEEDTEFLRHSTDPDWQPDEELHREMFLLTHELLEAEGFEHYEISNYAKPGFRSSHNEAYWAGRDYIGLGPGAVSTVGYKRWKNSPDTLSHAHAFLNTGYPLCENEPLSALSKRTERIFLGLRTSSGVEEELLSLWKASVNALIENDLAIRREGRIILTPDGLATADSIAELFL